MSISDLDIMTNDDNVFHKARKNGEINEQKAMEILTEKFKNVEYVNGLIDFYVENDIPIEVKSCQHFIKSGNDKYPMRYGRFTMEKSQHDFLEIQKGYYLFLVHENGFLIAGKLIPATDITFMKQITWRELMDRPKLNGESVNQ